MTVEHRIPEISVFEMTSRELEVVCGPGPVPEVISDDANDSLADFHIVLAILKSEFFLEATFPPQRSFDR